MGYEVRPYEDEDQPEVLDLLRATRADGLGPQHTAEFFRWKHLENPFGRSFMLLAVAAGQIIGLRAFLRWRFRAGDRVLRGVQAVDAATHPAYQRQGVFSHLTRTALSILRADSDFVYSTPNDKSLAGNLKLGWRLVGSFPVAIRVRRPLRVAWSFKSMRRGSTIGETSPIASAKAAADVLSMEQLDPLLLRAGNAEPRLSTAKDIAYLQWRFARPPHLNYQAVHLEDGERLRGVAIFRMRVRGALREATIVEVITPSGDEAAAVELLRRSIRCADMDYLTCHFPRGSMYARAALRTGFVRSPAGIKIVANPLRSDLEIDPTSMESWALSLGDLEIF